MSLGVQLEWIVKNDRRRKGITSMLRLLFVELEGVSVMMGIRSL